MEQKFSTRVTLSDVAARAGVASATVDRVIHERGNVSDEVRKRVLEAARVLRLKRILPSAHRGMVRLNVILARPELPLIHRMGFEFRRLAQRMDHSIVLHRTVLEDDNPATIVAALRCGSYDAVIVYAQDHP
ncbi:MAG: LacI family DNA-binding transcriptional regulator [Cypionkella sp.]